MPPDSRNRATPSDYLFTLLFGRMAVREGLSRWTASNTIHLSGHSSALWRYRLEVSRLSWSASDRALEEIARAQIAAFRNARLAESATLTANTDLKSSAQSSALRGAKGPVRRSGIGLYRRTVLALKSPTPFAGAPYLIASRTYNTGRSRITLGEIVAEMQIPELGFPISLHGSRPKTGPLSVTTIASSVKSAAKAAASLLLNASSLFLCSHQSARVLADRPSLFVG